MKTNKEKITTGFEEIHRICEDRGLMLGRTLPYRLAFDSAVKVRSIAAANSPEEARIQARVLALKHEDWLTSLGIPIHNHNFEASSNHANQGLLDISNHPHGLEANSAFARYDQETAQRVSLVLKDSLAQMPGGIGEGVQAFDPLIISRPKTKSKGRPSREDILALRQATKIAGQETLDRIKIGQKVMTFIEGTREKNGSLLTFQADLVAPAIEHIQATDAPKVLIVKTACISGAFPHKYEDMVDPRKAAPVYQAPIHYYRDVLDISDGTVDDIMTEARNIMERNLIHGIEQSLESLNQ